MVTYLTRDTEHATVWGSRKDADRKGQACGRDKLRMESKYPRVHSCYPDSGSETALLVTRLRLDGRLQCLPIEIRLVKDLGSSERKKTSVR